MLTRCAKAYSSSGSEL